MQNSEKMRWAYLAHTYRNTPIIKGPSGQCWAAGAIGGVPPDQNEVWCIYACCKAPVVRFNELDKWSKDLLCEETIFWFCSETTESYTKWNEDGKPYAHHVHIPNVSALHLNLGGTAPYCAKPLSEVQPALMWEGDTLRREAGTRPWIESQEFEDPANFMAGVTGLPKGCFSSVALAEKVVALCAKKYAYIRFDDIEMNHNGGHDFSCPIHFTDEPPVGKLYVDWDPFSFHEDGGKYAPADFIIRAARGERVHKKIYDGAWCIRACEKFGLRR